ncbi:MAG: lipopolysaccharide heptosyltransferase II [Verrucomicrobia bacterium]|nr:lipopolysaccharide heptosyltransferase II [Verrucomicrobiota bacterium]
MDRLIYFIALLFVSIMRALPLRCCFRCGQGLGWIAWLLLRHYRHLAERNLQVAFGGENSPAQLRHWTRQSFMMLGANIFSSLKMPAMKKEEINKTFTVEGEEYWKEFLDSSAHGGTVAALNHFGNWELNAQAVVCLKGRAAGTVYQPLRNRFIDDLINRDRRSRGVQTFDRRKDLSAATSLLRQGGLLGILTDQHAGDAGIWVPFFNKLASTSPLAATLAQKTGSALVPITIRTVGVAQWIIRIHPAIPTKERTIRQITCDLGEALSQEIRRSPMDWFWVHNRWKLPKPAFLLSRTRRGFFLPTKTEPDQLQKLKLLVRSPNWLGDACMAIPAIRTLKAGRPDLHLTVLTPAKIADLWNAIPEVDEIIIIPPKTLPWEVAKILKNHSTSRFQSAFDAALLLPNSLRSALEVWLAKIPRRIGRVGKKGKNRSWLINQPFPDEIEKVTHERDQYLAVARWLGAPEEGSKSEVDTAKQRRPREGWDPANHINRSCINHTVRIMIAPGAEYGPAKRWPADRFRNVMDLLSAKHKIDWILVGTAAERPIGKEILNKKFNGRVENKMGETSLSELIDLLKNCDLLLTNDTGTMHLADILGIPTIAIFGSTNPTLTGPQGADHRIFQHPVSCSPCFLRNCPIDFSCMLGIAPEAVAEGIEKMLELSSSSIS